MTGQDRLTQLHDLLDTLERTRSRDAADFLIGALAATCSDAAWSQALGLIRETFK